MTGLLRKNSSLLVTALIVVLLVLWMLQQYQSAVTASILLSALTLGALYFLVTSGLSLIFGLMDVLNFAHGLFFMFGAYVGYTFYANPRMLLNTLPFAFALGGGLAIMGFLMTFLRSRTLPLRMERVVQWGFGLIAIALLVWGVWGFDIVALASNAATSAGGAIPTNLAQGSADRYAGRLMLLAMAGLAAGVAFGRKQTQHGARRGRPTWISLMGGVLALIIAFGMVGLRAQGELLITGDGSLVNPGLPSNLRFVIALLIGALGGAGAGALVEWSMIRPLYTRPIYQVLLTLGLVFVGTEMIRGVWGPVGFYMDIPEAFSQRGAGCRPLPDMLHWFGSNCASIDVLGRPFPSYRLFIIGLGIVMFVVVFLLLRRTRLGMIIRAGVQDSDMVQALGINVRRVFTLVFALGCGLAALGGVAAAPFIGVNPGMGQEFLLLAFIAVVIGGMGSYSGAALGALLVGLARAFGDQLVLSGVQLPGMAEAFKMSPSIARASTVLLMAIVLLWRPSGLFGRKD